MFRRKTRRIWRNSPGRPAGKFTPLSSYFRHLLTVPDTCSEDEGETEVDAVCNSSEEEDVRPQVQKTPKIIRFVQCPSVYV